MRRQQQRFPGLLRVGPPMQRDLPRPAGQQFDTDIALTAFLRREPAHDADRPDARVGRLDRKDLADVQPVALPRREDGAITVVALVLDAPCLRGGAHLLGDFLRRKTRHDGFETVHHPELGQRTAAFRPPLRPPRPPLPAQMLKHMDHGPHVVDAFQVHFAGTISPPATLETKSSICVMTRPAPKNLAPERTTDTGV